MAYASVRSAGSEVGRESGFFKMTAVLSARNILCQVWTEGMEYQWQVYDLQRGRVDHMLPSGAKAISLSTGRKKSGGYWLYCTARNALGEEASDVAGVTAAVRPVTIEGLSWIYQEDEIQIGAAVSSPD